VAKSPAALASPRHRNVDDIAGHDAEQKEDDDRNPDQGHEHQSKAPHDISKHLATPVGAYSANLDTALAIGMREDSLHPPDPHGRGATYLSSQTSS
jgi:hypothetical protein